MLPSVGADAYAFVMVAGTLREWLAAHPPPDASFRQTLALVSDRVRAGEDVRFAVREFLDEFYLLPRDDLRVRAIRSRPDGRSTRRRLSGRAGRASGRDSWDRAPVRLLAGELGLRSAEEVLAVAESVFGDRLDSAARFFVEELFDESEPGARSSGV